MDRIKYHNQIRDVSVKSSNEEYVYDVCKAEKLYNNSTYTYHQLSVMKQDNIQAALQDNSVPLDTIKWVVSLSCGYCFKYPGCENCPFNYCIVKIEYKKMKKSKTKHTFAKYHLAWRIKLNLLK